MHCNVLTAPWKKFSVVGLISASGILGIEYMTARRCPINNLTSRKTIRLLSTMTANNRNFSGMLRGWAPPHPRISWIACFQSVWATLWTLITQHFLILSRWVSWIKNAQNGTTCYLNCECRLSTVIQAIGTGFKLEFLKRCNCELVFKNVLRYTEF